MKKGRPLEYDPEQVLEVAMNIFLEKGYESTTLEDLLAETKISRSSFYHAYGNKLQLFEQCFDLFCDKQIKKMENRLKQSLTGRTFIENFLYDLASGVSGADEPRFGAFVMSAHEFGGCDIYVSQLASATMLRFNGVLLTAIKKGQSEGVINKEKDPDSLALFLMSSIAGIRTMVSAKAPPDQINKIVGFTMFALD